MGINMELPLLFWEVFLQDFGVFLRGFVPFESKENLWGQVLMLDKRSWLASGIPVHPKKVFNGVEVRGLYRILEFLYTKRTWLYGPRFGHRGTVMLEQETAFPKMLQNWKQRSFIHFLDHFPTAGCRWAGTNPNWPSARGGVHPWQVANLSIAGLI